jgi:signal transduction histidine kinase
MKIAPVPAKERERLKALNQYGILNTEHETAYDFITELASKACGMPVSALSFIDGHRQWFKSCNGVEISETTAFSLLCSQAIDQPDKVLVVKDLSESDWFGENPFVHKGQPLVFYAAAPIVTPEGYVVGLIAVLDTKPNNISLEHKQQLLLLAAQVVTLLELRKKARLLKQREDDIKMAYTDLENIAHLASHDLRTPLNNIISLAQLINEEFGEKIGTDGGEYVKFITETAYYMSDLVSSIHSYSKASKLAVDHHDRINTLELLMEIKPLLKIPPHIRFEYHLECYEITAPSLALKQVLFHLLLNAVQYCDKEAGIIDFTISENNAAWTFVIEDNGEGIAEEDTEKMYYLFKRLRNREKNGENMGIGLAIVKRLIEKMHGTLTAISTPGKGSTFSFSIPK